MGRQAKLTATRRALAAANRDRIAADVAEKKPLVEAAAQEFRADAEAVGLMTRDLPGQRARLRAAERADHRGRGRQSGSPAGFEPLWLPDFLFPPQVHLTGWAIHQGRGALLEDCGLGKTRSTSTPSSSTCRAG